MKESLLIALRLKLAFGITMLLLCSVTAQADSMPIRIPCSNIWCVGDTNTVSIISQPPGVIGLGPTDTFISFGFRMVDNEGVDMNGVLFLTGPPGSAFYPNSGLPPWNIGVQSECSSPGSEYRGTFDCNLSVDIGNESTATPGIYTWGLGLNDWANPPGGLVLWIPRFTTDVLAPARAVDEPSTWLVLIPGLLALVGFRLKKATGWLLMPRHLKKKYLLWRRHSVQALKRNMKLTSGGVSWLFVLGWGFNLVAALWLGEKIGEEAR